MLGDVSSAPDFPWLRKQWVTIMSDPLVITIANNHVLTSVFGAFGCKYLKYCIGCELV